MDRKIRLEVGNITNSQAQTPAFAMVLQEVDGNRHLPIIIGPAEAQSITFKLNDIQPMRPLTHDLFATTLAAFEIVPTEVLIYKVIEGIFYSYIYFERNGERARIDARTSDAIAISLRFDCPIYVFEPILEKERIPAPKPSSAGQASGEREVKDTKDVREMLKTKDLKTLKRALSVALESENYELASILRDEISSRKK